MTKQISSDSTSRHERLCKVCKHAQKDEVEKDFINWMDVTSLCKKYTLERDNIFRHARATNLYEKRAANKKGYLNIIKERSLQAKKVNASDGINATKLEAQLEGLLVDKHEITEKADKELTEALEKLDGLDIGKLKAVIKALENQEG